MELKKNPKHKKLDLSQLDLFKRKRLGVRVGAGLLSLILLTGCGKDVTDHDKYDSGYVESGYEQMIDEEDEIVVPEHAPSETISIPSYFYVYQFDDDRVVKGDTYTYDDLAHVEECSVVIQEDGNYDYLNYMPNLKEISITDVTGEQKLASIDGKRFPAGIKIKILSPMGTGVFDQESYGFLRRIPSIDTLQVGNDSSEMNIDSTFLQSLKNVKNLKLGLGYDSNFHYQDLTYLDSLELLGRPYDIALYFSLDSLEELEKAGVHIQTENLELIQKTRQEIRNLYQSLSVPEDATDQEKLNAILTCVLSKLTYDPEVKDQLYGSGKVDSSLNESFYENGYLTAALEDPTQICGNYAALTYALCQEAGLSVFNMSSNNHAWNAVQVGDYYYYVDSTWLDGVTVNQPVTHSEQTADGLTITYDFIPQSAEEVFQEGNQEKISQLPWYMEDPTNFSQVENDKESHHASSIPSGLTLTAIPEDEKVQNEGGTSVDTENTEESIPDITNQKFKLEIDGKVFIIGGAALAGILSALGIGLLVHKKKEKKRLERLRRQREFDSMFSSSSTSSFGESNYGSSSFFDPPGFGR